MVGNKHKNGIICTFPDCNRPMRTQKFKMHFSKKHLKEGEVYSVEHRRQYEVAREDNVRTIVKHELIPATATTAAPTLSSVEEVSRTETTNASVISTAAVAAAHEAIQTQAKELALLQSQQTQLASHYVASDVKTEEAGDAVSPPVSANTASVLSATSAEQTSGSKRLASAMETSQGAIDPTSALLMQFIALMDQRFQELVGKMGEMIDVQKDLIDTLQASNPNGQAPASAFSSAVEVIMKRRKTEMSPSGNENGKAETNVETQGLGNNGVVL
ncbi:hypothetical protein KRP22_013354 [Phytophthora ramorum]|uniref:Uncharacterized protein n=1 Tax=Phytophthora ramorum TaxID=164328 RepID=H3H422_PHYRM|nr:hypothetical protein KRP22_10854 [Phytophthora ramorum]